MTLSEDEAKMLVVDVLGGMKDSKIEYDTSEVLGIDRETAMEWRLFVLKAGLFEDE